MRDRCPNEPEDKDGFEDQDGCPDPDNDKDQIPDVVDKCPNDPETYNGFEDEDGCPDKGSVIIQDNNIVILDKIKFKTNSAEILPESNKILDAVATTINHHPEFELMEIAGHADERSSDQYNLRLTQDRVNSVLAALVQRGVAREKVRSKGYGEYCPEDNAHDESAWEKNRRVEFKIVKTKDGPTGVELGCPNATAHGVAPEPGEQVAESIQVIDSVAEGRDQGNCRVAGPSAARARPRNQEGHCPSSDLHFSTQSSSCWLLQIDFSIRISSPVARFPKTFGSRMERAAAIELVS